MHNTDQTEPAKLEPDSNKIGADDDQKIEDLKSKMYGTPRNRSLRQPHRKRNHLREEHSSMRTKTTIKADYNNKIVVARKQEEDAKSMDDF